MIKSEFTEQQRSHREITIETDLVVAGGGLAGVCCAITAARAGKKVVLVQDRPVLGGNASSEVRLWALGATSHMGNNNRWSREGGVINEIMLDNLNRNSAGNPLIFDSILIDKVHQEKNIQLLLNTAALYVEKKEARLIKSLQAFCSQNSTRYNLQAPLFADCTGDGLLAFSAGAAFRIGSESRHEFDEKLAPEQENNELLGHSLFFYSKKVAEKVTYTPPSFAYSADEIDAMPRSKNIGARDSGCKFWWLEYGGIKDTIHESEEIKWELWRVVYGIWDYIKNSGKFEDVDNLTLEWVGTIPGKRESRRFEGLYMLKQSDIVEQKTFDDAVSYGGWAIDLHPAEGLFTNKPACTQFHAKGVYQIPYRCFVSKDIDNLFLGGRIISATHMAFGSTRVMITCAHGGQAIGEAAALCVEHNVQPNALLEPEKMQQLQHRLNLNGHGLAGIPLQKSETFKQAQVTASSSLTLSKLPANGPWLSLKQAVAQLLPLPGGEVGEISVDVNALAESEMQVEFRVSEKAQNYTPDVILKCLKLDLKKGKQQIKLDFSDVVTEQQYVFVCFLQNPQIEIKTSEQRITGLMSVFNKVHKAVSNQGKQIPPANSGIESFEFWTPERRPLGHNIAFTMTPEKPIFSVDNLANGHMRPWLGSNAWVADLADEAPSLSFVWKTAQTLKGVQLYFDADADHALETVLMEHPETKMPFTVTDYRILTGAGELLAQVTGNYQSLNRIYFEQPVTTDKLVIQVNHPDSQVPASLFDVEFIV
ncbi:FAD-dependent oxidoreductase [Gayadomonas joobiniege]|uniref:FAD-dependent oxidoreductase n=1 Tax=Gayadomonas joobiniege TaxID=1234606 RepID=UPI000373C838|nr:FAD-dependent oxidoreductase [Gayadomonas joobiniege]